jgi:hypothetical protein
VLGLRIHGAEADYAWAVTRCWQPPKLQVVVLSNIIPGGEIGRPPSNAMKHGGSRLSLIVVVVLVTVLTGCERGRHSRDIKVGDMDYPLENPHPAMTFQFEAVLPPKLPIHFKLVYMASINAKPKLGAVPPCHYVTDVERMSPFTVSVPLQLRFEKHDPHVGEYYRGIVAIDRYSPGRCQWELIAGMYSVDDDPKHDVPLFHYAPFSEYGQGDGEVLHCMRVPASYRSTHPDSALPPVACATADRGDRLLATAESMAARRPNLDAADLGHDVVVVGRKTLSIKFTFWDRDNPLPRVPLPVY